MLWDLFCQVIDNHGDAGVCWRLAAELARRGHGVRLWIDDPRPIAWMAPGGAPGVEVLPWSGAAAQVQPGDAVIEAFGCDPPDAYLQALAGAARARGSQPPWINLEYLSAEGYVERSHGLPSPVGQGPAAGLVKHFFYPGFTDRTGGLLREGDFSQRRAGFDAAQWLAGHGIQRQPGRLAVSLFCYEPPALPVLLGQLAQATGADLLVTAGRAAAATQEATARLDTADPGWNAAARLQLHYLPLLSQRDYDHLLWSCDLHFVRGEDSLVRALLAGAPFVWQLYPQADGAHHAKLAAFLQWLQPPAGWAAWQALWNGLAAEAPPLDVAPWRAAAAAAAARAHALPELASGLEHFVRNRSRI